MRVAVEIVRGVEVTTDSTPLMMFLARLTGVALIGFHLLPLPPLPLPSLRNSEYHIVLCPPPVDGCESPTAVKETEMAPERVSRLDLCK